MQFEDYLCKADSSYQGEPKNRVSSLGNTVDFCTAKLLLDEPITYDSDKEVETSISNLKMVEPIAFEVLLNVRVNELLARKRQNVEELFNNEVIEPR